MTAHSFSHGPQGSTADAAVRGTTRREFLQGTAAVAGAALLAPGLLCGAEKPPIRTAADQVPLGKTGLKLSRLGFGTGSNSGHVQRALASRPSTG